MSFVFLEDHEPPQGARIRQALLQLFREDALNAGIEVPIDDRKKEAWIKFIVHQIESAYGLQVYTPLQGRLDRALDGIRRFCTTFNVNSERIIGEILAAQTPQGGEH